MIDIYRKGEGRTIRIAAYIAYLTLAVFFCIMVYDLPSLDSSLNRVIWTKSFLGVTVVVRWILLPTVAAFVVLAYIGIRVLNKVKIADYLIESESELRKVSWPKRNECISASVAILCMVVFTVFYLILVDQGLSKLMEMTSDIVGRRIGF